MVRIPGAGRQSLTGVVRANGQRLAFGMLYGIGARGYDRFTAWLFLGEWARWQRAALPFLPRSGFIVELGAGTGALAAEGAAPSRLWLGIERSAPMLAIARRRLAPAGPRFARATADRLPLPSATADAVVATFPTRYILDPRVADEVRRVLKPGGQIVIVLSGTLAPHGLRRRLRRRALRAFYGAEHQERVPAFALDGFDGQTRLVPTRHGQATLYLGTPIQADRGAGVPQTSPRANN